MAPSATKKYYLEEARSLLEDFSRNGRCFGPFWLYTPEGETSPTVLLEMQAYADGLNLAFIKAMIPGKGLGQEVLSLICKLADKNNCPIYLEVDPTKGTPEVVLFRIYKRFQFKPLKNRSHLHLVRYPNPQGVK